MRIEDMAVAEQIDTREGTLNAVNPIYELRSDVFPFSRQMFIGYIASFFTYEKSKRFDVEISIIGPGEEMLFMVGVNNVIGMITFDNPHATRDAFTAGGPITFNRPGIHETRISMNGRKLNAVNFEVIQEEKKK